jgi:hypothetical protein
MDDVMNKMILEKKKKALERDISTTRGFKLCR